MTERPILFSAPMVRAILAGTKTQTRRVVKNQQQIPDDWQRWEPDARDALIRHRCPYGQPGDRLWVREAFMHEPADYCWEASVSIPSRPAVTTYRADFEGDTRGAGWKPSIHMPRALSRILLEITAVRVERLNEISRGDAMAEGCPHPNMASGPDPRVWFQHLWESINGADAWAANQWVWVVEFKRVPS